ncbi:MAG: ATP-binding protein [Dehalococcoidia bacterium]|jgi:signal transduction histidine kinase|nr:ATP-binding protein [Dehalococcoidia bacterium]
MAIIDNLLVQIWIGSLVAMVILGVIISVWAAWRTISRQRSQLLAVNTELDLRVTDLSTEINLRQQAQREVAEQAAALARADEMQRSRQRIVSAQESLRKEIAQQLHGSVQNRLIFLVLRLKQLEATAEPKGVALELADLREKFEELLEQEIRSIVHQLYPYILRRGFVPALRSLGDQIESVISIEMDLDEELVRKERADRNLIPEQAKLAAYRIAEEALTNMVKHANASKISVRLETPFGGWFRLTVQDDGQGFAVEESSEGMGIVGIRDYAEAIGGECVILGAPGKGTQVTATLPLVILEKEFPETVSLSE